MEPGPSHTTSSPAQDPARSPARTVTGREPWANTPALKLMATTSYQAYRADHPRPVRDPAQLKLEVESRRDAGGYLNIGEVPRGYGVWKWLQPKYDEWLALDHGLEKPEQVEAARQKGVFAMGSGPDAGAHTVWIPNFEFFNPVNHPQGEGHFEFHTSVDRANVQSRLAGMVDLEGDTPFPSAGEVWAYQQEQEQRINDGEEDVDAHADINIVWVPDELATERILDAFDIGADSDEEMVDAEFANCGVNIGELDAETRLTHEPANSELGNVAGADQTGVDGEAHYQSRMLPEDSLYAKQITVDRSRARASIRQDWKCYVANTQGRFVKYIHFDTLDWTSSDDTEKLNKWREQSYKRYGWPLKRKAARLDYTDAERAWLFEYVKQAKGGHPSLSIKALTKKFNTEVATPQRPRDETGILTLVDRLRKEYIKHGGKMDPARVKRATPRKGKGW